MGATTTLNNEDMEDLTPEKEVEDVVIAERLGRMDLELGSNNTDSTSFLDRFPDDLLLHIADHTGCGPKDVGFQSIALGGDGTTTGVWTGIYILTSDDPQLRERNRTFNEANNPVYQLSMVNKRLRRVFLPWVFWAVSFVFGEEEEEEEVKGIREKIGKYRWLAGFIRNVSFLTLSEDDAGFSESKTFIPFLVDLLDASSDLQRIRLPKSFNLGWWKEHIELLRAVERHPCEDLQLVYDSRIQIPQSQQLQIEPPEPPSDLVSLSRVVLGVSVWLDSEDKATDSQLFAAIKSLVDLGLQIESIDFNFESDHYIGHVDPRVSKAWRDLTFPGLRVIRGWKVSEECRWEELRGFIERHPMLEKMSVKDIGLQTVKWLAEVPFASFVEEIPWEGCRLDSMVVIRDVGKGEHVDWKVMDVRVTLLHQIEGQRDNLTGYTICELAEEDRKTLTELGKVLPPEVESLYIDCRNPVSRSSGLVSRGQFEDIYDLLNRPHLDISVPPPPASSIHRFMLATYFEFPY